MNDIKSAYQAGKIGRIEAARQLTRHNGNPLAGNLQVVARWAHR